MISFEAYSLEVLHLIALHTPATVLIKLIIPYYIPSGAYGCRSRVAHRTKSVDTLLHALGPTKDKIKISNLAVRRTVVSV
jgi:hypothetical protein